MGLRRTQHWMLADFRLSFENSAWLFAMTSFIKKEKWLLVILDERMPAVTNSPPKFLQFKFTTLYTWDDSIFDLIS